MHSAVIDASRYNGNVNDHIAYKNNVNNAQTHREIRDKIREYHRLTLRVRQSNKPTDNGQPRYDANHEPAVPHSPTRTAVRWSLRAPLG